MILNIIIAIIMIGLIVLIHEFGHFIVAKANGVAVVEFSIGFGPKLFGIKKGDTEYCLKLIPFGGACIMLGDDMLTQSDDGSEDENGEDEDSDDLPAKERREELLKNYDADKAFAAKTVWSRIAIIAAGPVFNFLLAFVFAVIIIGSVGTDPCTVDVVEDSSPAAAAGLQVGDEITKINNNGIAFSKEYAFYQAYHASDTMNITYKRDGQKYTTTVTPEYRKLSVYRLGITISDNTLVASVSDNSAASKAGIEKGDVIVSVDGVKPTDDNKIPQIINNSGGKEIEMVVKRDGQDVTLKVTPTLVESEEYYTGFDSYGYRVKVSPAQTILCSFKEVGYWIETVVKSVGMMFTGKLGINDLSGPVGVVDSVNTVVEQSKPDGAWYVCLNIFQYIVMLSANLGVMNLLPLPALDGGRLLFMFIEVVRGKPVKKEREGMVHFVGMVLLMILMVYIMFKDIVNLF